MSNNLIPRVSLLTSEETLTWSGYIVYLQQLNELRRSSSIRILLSSSCHLVVQCSTIVFRLLFAVTVSILISI